jgi:hypothetical protein
MDTTLSNVSLIGNRILPFLIGDVVHRGVDASASTMVLEAIVHKETFV